MSPDQPPPDILSPTDAPGRRRRRRWWLAGIGVAVVVVGGVVAAAVATRHRTPAAAPATTTTTTTTRPAPSGPVCPLTGAPAPGGSVPQRPALAVKVGNYTGDRPSAGLNQADLVVEEPVEGAITRLVAVFQCQAPTEVGDLRSAREPDVAILSQLSHPLFAHAGGIDPVLNLIADAPVTDVDVLRDATGVFHPDGRTSPYDTFVTPSALWAADAGDRTPPAPVFTYSPALPAGAVAGSGASVHVPFSSTSDVTWTWDAATGRYLRSYAGERDVLVDGTQTAAVDVVVETVETFAGPWVENSEGALEVEVQATGSGPVTVLEGGAAVTGTWTRSSVTSPATLTTSGGRPLTLLPGNAWIELVPQGVDVTTTAAPAGTAPTTATGA